MESKSIPHLYQAIFAVCAEAPFQRTGAFLVINFRCCLAVFVEISLANKFALVGYFTRKVSQAFPSVAWGNCSQSDQFSFGVVFASFLIAIGDLCFVTHPYSTSEAITYVTTQFFKLNICVVLNTMVVLTVVATENPCTVYFDKPPPKADLVRLISFSLPNSWLNVKTSGIISLINNQNMAISEKGFPPGHYTSTVLAKILNSVFTELNTKITAEANTPTGALVIKNPDNVFCLAGIGDKGLSYTVASLGVATTALSLLRIRQSGCRQSHNLVPNTEKDLSFTCNLDFCTYKFSAEEKCVLYAWTSDEWIKS